MSPFMRKEKGSQWDRSMTYAVHGFWSGDSVRVSQSRNYRTKKWGAPEINWSRGGRDDAEPDEAIAAECFAQAILDAVKVAKIWRTQP